LFKHYEVYYLFSCFFLLFLTFSFQFLLSVLVKKFWKVLCSFIFWLQILSKIFWKSWNIFLKNIDILNPKLLTNSIIYYLFFLLSFLMSFFPISPNQTCQKILYIFVVLYYTDYRFYQRILENSWILIKKKRDIVNIKHFQNSIVYYLLFNF